MSLMFDKIKGTIARVPRGTVASYGQIAELAGFPGAARQVVWALNHSSGLPWHRILGSSGKILLTGNNALEQRMRLEMEGVILNGMRVNMKVYAWKPAKKAVRTGTKSKRTRTKS